MEMCIRHDAKEAEQPVEIDIRKILEQMGIQAERWPEEYRRQVPQSQS